VSGGGCAYLLSCSSCFSFLLYSLPSSLYPLLALLTAHWQAV
jgi:hypothetical protein